MSSAGKNNYVSIKPAVVIISVHSTHHLSLVVEAHTHLYLTDETLRYMETKAVV